MGKFTISKAMFNSFLYVYQRVFVFWRSRNPHHHFREMLWWCKSSPFFPTPDTSFRAKRQDVQATTWQRSFEESSKSNHWLGWHQSSQQIYNTYIHTCIYICIWSSPSSSEIYRGLGAPNDGTRSHTTPIRNLSMGLGKIMGMGVPSLGVPINSKWYSSYNWWERERESHELFCRG